MTLFHHFTLLCPPFVRLYGMCPYQHHSLTALKLNPSPEAQNEAHFILLVSCTVFSFPAVRPTALLFKPINSFNWL